MPGTTMWSPTFVNDGGPLVVLPYEAVHCWQGTAEDVVRAGAARKPFDLLKESHGPVLVASSTARRLYAACWLRLASQPGIVLAGWLDGWEVEEVGAGANEYVEDRLTYRLTRTDVGWEPQPWRMEIRSGILLLLHAGAPAEGVRLTSLTARLGDAVPAAIDPGRYALETAAIEELTEGDVLCRCVLCRWIPTGTAQQRRSERRRSAP